MAKGVGNFAKMGLTGLGGGEEGSVVVVLGSSGVCPPNKKMLSTVLGTISLFCLHLLPFPVLVGGVLFGLVYRLSGVGGMLCGC
jgi:hypothetical protein